MEKFRLLVFIDDDKPTNVFHKIITKKADITEESLFFSSPIEALNYFEELSKLDNPTLPDAIFLDINMPEITGWEFLDKYADLDIFPSPVIVMLTTSLLNKDHQKAQSMELVYKLINKPLSKEVLYSLHSELKKLP